VKPFWPREEQLKYLDRRRQTMPQAGDFITEFFGVTFNAYHSVPNEFIIGFGKSD